MIAQMVFGLSMVLWYLVSYKQRNTDNPKCVLNVLSQCKEYCYHTVVLKQVDGFNVTYTFVTFCKFYLEALVLEGSR